MQLEGWNGAVRSLCCRAIFVHIHEKILTNLTS